MKIFNVETLMGMSPQEKDNLRDDYEVFHHPLYQITIALEKTRFRELLGQIQLERKAVEL
jgi:hypothetical protein